MLSQKFTLMGLNMTKPSTYEMKFTQRLRNHLLKKKEEQVARLDAKLGKEGGGGDGGGGWVGRGVTNRESLHSNLFLCATPYVYHLSVKTPV